MKIKTLLIVIMGILITIVGIIIMKDEGDQRTYASPTNNIASLFNSKPQHDVYPEVWVKNGYDGPSFEYKSNCGSDYDTLEECFLWDLTRVYVTTPSGEIVDIEKDFNIQEYSGEITRRWVIYGSADAGFPPAGDYVFHYLRDGEELLAQTVDFQPTIVDYPTNITWQRDGDDLLVQWDPPSGITSDMTYKVLLFPENQDVISRLLDSTATSARLSDIPLEDGHAIGMNVAIYFDVGYAYPEDINFNW